jgi:hypothetical protein
MLGIIGEFIARFFGYTDNPLAFSYQGIPLFAGTLAAMIIIYGYFALIGKKAKQSTTARRKAVLLIVLGGFMLISFFLSRQIVPLIFG